MRQAKDTDGGADTDFTEVGLAKRFAEANPDLRFDGSARKPLWRWLQRSPHGGFVHAPPGLPVRRAIAMLDALLAEADRLDGLGMTRGGAALRKHAVSSRTAGRISGMLRIAQALCCF